MPWLAIDANLDSVSVANVAALAAQPATQAGALAYVATLRAFFQLDPQSTIAADGISIIVCANGGRWIRLESVASPWTEQDIWFVNGSSGSDESDGATAATALQTYQELIRRVGYDWQIGPDRAVVITQIGDHAAGDYIDFEPYVHINSALEFTGQYVVARSGTLTAVTQSNAATNTQPTVSDTVGGSWAAYADATAGDYRPVLVPSKNAVFMLEKDVGASTARITDARTLDFATAAYVALAIGDAYQVLSLPVFPPSSFQFWSAGIDNTLSTSPPSLATNRITFSYLKFAHTHHLSNDSGSFKAYYRACQFTDSSTSGTNTTTQSWQTLGNVTFTACGFMRYSLPTITNCTTIAAVSCLFATVTAISPVASRLLFSSSAITCDIAFSRNSYATISSLRACYLNDGARVRAESQSVLFFSATTCGTGNTSNVLCWANQASHLLFLNGITLHPTGTTSTFTLDNETSLWPTLEQWGGVVPSAATSCNTIAKLSAAPFNGSAHNPKTSSHVRFVSSGNY